MTRAEAVESLKECWMQYGMNLLVDGDGRFDEHKTFTGKQLQSSIIPSLWLDQDPEHWEFFNEVTKDGGYFSTWEDIKREAFPDENLYGA